MRLTDADEAVLKDVVGLKTGWYVTEENFVEAGHLVEAGLARVSWEGDMFALFPTEKGVASALRRGLVKRRVLPSPYEGPYERVDAA